MKNRKMLLPALFSIVLVLSLILPAWVAGVSATVPNADDRSITNHLAVANSGLASAMALNTPTGNVTPIVAAGARLTVGLKSDGTLVAVGANRYGECNVGCWMDIVQVAAGGEYTVGLRSDGTVVTVGNADYGQWNVGGWTDIAEVAAGWGHTVAVRENGTVVAVGANWYEQCNVEDWTDIVQVAAGYYHTVGLRADGTVVTVGDNGSGQRNVGDWTDIVQVAAGYYHTVGVKCDGTVVAVGSNSLGECNVGNWTDIIQVAATYCRTVGVKSDGTVVTVGNNEYGQCDVGGWTDIVQVAAGWGHTVGVKTDGTVVAVGNNEFGQCNLSAWNLVLAVPPSLCNIQPPVEPGPGNVIATYGEGYLEDFNGLLVLHVKGSPYEMGYQNGFLLRDSIQALDQYLIQKMIDMGFSYDYMVNCAQAMEPHIPLEYIQEMEGLADGASMNYTDVLLAHIYGDIQYYGSGWTGCSGFVVFGNATMDGHLYHGRSLDVSLCSAESVGLITVYEPENGTGFVNVGHFGFVGVHTGINKEGITLEQNVSSSSNKTLDGMPSKFMLRKVLQYSNNLTEAIDIICQTDRTTGWNILLGDGKNLSACAVEISDNYCRVFWAGDPAEDIEPHYGIPNAVRRTNHYVDPDLAATQRPTYDPRFGGSWNRYERLSQLIEDNYGNMDAEMSMEFLRTQPVAWAAINLQSVVFDSTDLELWVADSAFNTPAYEREFIHLSYDDLFHPVTLSISSTDGGSVTTPGEGTFTYDQGTIVSLTAETEEGYRFDGWTGDVNAVADVHGVSTNITMDDSYSIMANFEEEAPPSGWCFIATVAYGTPLAGEIQILREFRDEYLLTHPMGQAFVDFYYEVSPPIAEFITEHPSLKPIVRAGLLPVVAMSTIAVDTTPAEKLAVVGLLALVSAVLAIWATRRRGRDPEHS